MEERLHRHASLGAVQTVLKRLEAKKFLTSNFGKATKARGGKRKRLYEITADGQKALDRNRNQRNALWEAIPKLTLTSV
jgi:DNA-binding PadR family transcriptional regulator